MCAAVGTGGVGHGKENFLNTGFYINHVPYLPHGYNTHNFKFKYLNNFT
jgi:hypothetical protein